MTIQVYQPIDLRSQLANRHLFRKAMLEQNPQAISFFESTVDLRGKEVLYVLETLYNQKVDEQIGYAIYAIARKHKKTWQEMIVTTKYNDQAFKRYAKDLTQRLREACEREFSQTATIKVPGFRELVVCHEKGCSYQITPITEEQDKTEVEKLIREKGLEGNIHFEN